ncbi:putative retrotransposon hot spot (RHS) protein, partial [Trypanosoma conorhini]
DQGKMPPKRTRAGPGKKESPATNAPQPEEEEERTRLPLPEGFYGSVLNAKWSHVLGFPEVDEYEEELVRMEVKEGQRPTQSWEYKSRGMSFELDGAVEQFSPPRPWLMVLSSEKGWPYSLQEGTALADCYVTAEAERVWKRLDGFLRMLFRHSTGGDSDVKRVLLLGTPGIGQSMTVGSYLLYQLLHYDAEQLQVAIYCLGGELAYVFDKTTQAVTEHEGAGSIVDAINDLSRRGKKGYIVYDVSEEGAPPPSGLPPDGWGMIVLGSLKQHNYKALATQLHTGLTVMNCPDEEEVKAMCAWRKRDCPEQERNKYYGAVYSRMFYVGPLPRYVLTEAEFNERTAAVESALQAITASAANDYLDRKDGNIWCPKNPFQQLVKIVRESKGCGLEGMRCTDICRSLGARVAQRLGEVLGSSEGFWRLVSAGDRRLRF